MYIHLGKIHGKKIVEKLDKKYYPKKKVINNAFPFQFHCPEHLIYSFHNVYKLHTSPQLRLKNLSKYKAMAFFEKFLVYPVYQLKFFSAR